MTRVLQRTKDIVRSAQRASWHWEVTLRSRRRASYLRRALDTGDLELLVWAWGNEKFSASPEYLAEMVEAARCADGPVLECGSGLSTLLLGREAEVYSLEHDPHWAGWTRRALERHSVRAQVLDAPLRSYGDFTWYSVVELPDSFALVVCDGPPAYLGGRYGLFPVLGKRIAGDVLLDDVNRPQEQAIISRWVAEFGISALRVDCAKPYARLSGPVVGNGI